MRTLAFDKKVRVVSALVEGCSMRATERLCGVSHETVINLAVAIGEACRRLHHVRMRDLQVNVLELDEIWSFVGKKERRVKPEDPPEMGDQYAFIGMDANRKAISCVVGKRDAWTTSTFITDLRDRIVNRPQISTDGFRCYPGAIGSIFGPDVDYAMIIKEYGLLVEDDHKYSPPKCIRAERKVVSGSPDHDKISTSYIERQNLTCRMQMRRFTRLTNAFSKKLRNHEAAVALYVCWYNFVRVHETLKATPAMALGITDHPWSVAEMMHAALQIAPEDAPRLPAREEPTPAPADPPLPVVDDRQLCLLDWQPRPLGPPRPTDDMVQVELFPDFAPAAPAVQE